MAVYLEEELVDSLTEYATHQSHDLQMDYIAELDMAPASAEIIDAVRYAWNMRQTRNAGRDARLA